MPVALSKEEIQHRTEIIQASETLGEAAQILGMKYTSVARFACRQQVKVKGRKKMERVAKERGVTMEKALDERGQEICKRFFNVLVYARKRGFIINVPDAMSCWNKMAREGRLDGNISN